MGKVKAEWTLADEGVGDRHYLSIPLLEGSLGVDTLTVSLPFWEILGSSRGKEAVAVTLGSAR